MSPPSVPPWMRCTIMSHDALPLMVDAMGDVDLTRFSVEESTRQSP
ncbi:hypothetical protein BIFANG_03149 [Bifidobacterium angulatum DSM 20098 = JCM 7096]|uniref:Uncharacterized protein n=1 Tax=Bifidobacterium angulatum DSM 20098 = JCM 7096 TaxID=518635 RepID=C4FFN5_9BIFI|nr:hypothetical protein BIFANG_03149 [Bifidobacterium angulatum DSM 20098 = JCM 7096]BAQ96643.1 hypothetical protein BBAG_1021 [Bifidobacterium angulatum DSM 20098 = JCM 7096]